MTNMRPRRTNQSGSFELIGMLIACAVLLIMAAVAAPSIVKLTQASNENSAAGQLAQLGAAEFSMSQIKGVFVAPANLLGQLALPISCTNPMLASGAQIQAPSAYNSICPPGPTLSTPSGCAGVQGYSAYSISLTPINSLEAQRQLFMTSTDGGVIHFTDQNRPATISDPVMPISVPAQGSVSTILVVQNTTGNGGTTGTTFTSSSGSGANPSAYPGGENTFMPINAIQAVPSPENQWSAIGMAKTAVSFSATISPTVASGFVRVGLVDLTTITTDPIQNQVPAFQPPPYNALLCDIQVGQTGCAATNGSQLPYLIGATDEMEIQVVANGGPSYTGGVSWTVTYSN